MPCPKGGGCSCSSEWGGHGGGLSWLGPGGRRADERAGDDEAS